jgi:hypothetical protein
VAVGAVLAKTDQSLLKWDTCRRGLLNLPPLSLKVHHIPLFRVDDMNTQVLDLCFTYMFLFGVLAKRCLAFLCLVAAYVTTERPSYS